MRVLAIFLAALMAGGPHALAQAFPAYPGQPDIAPPVTRVAKYAPLVEGTGGPAIDPNKGYHVTDLGHGAHLVTEGVYQVLVLTTADGVILADAPPNIGARLLAALEEIAPGRAVTHLIYSHAHIDHIGFAGEIAAANPGLAIVAHRETAEILSRAGDPARPAPTVTFDGTMEPFMLATGGAALRLVYPGPNHLDGNIEIWHQPSRTLMLIDVVFPGWMMWRRLALAEDIPGTFDVIRSINDRYDYATLVSGHLGRPATRRDVDVQIEFMTDLHTAAGRALGSVKPGEGVDPADFANPWAVFDNYIDRVVVQCVAELAPKWSGRLSGFDVFVYDQCLAMEQSLRVDGPSL